MERWMDTETFLLSLAAAFAGVAAGVLSAHVIARTAGVIPTTPRTVLREAAPSPRPVTPRIREAPPSPPQAAPSDGSLVIVVGLLLLVLLGPGRKGGSGKRP